MNNLFLLLVLSTFTFLAVSLPNKTVSDENIFDLFYQESKVSCPALTASILSNRHSDYIKHCEKFPLDQLTRFNEQEFLCVGVLDAGYRLCKTIGKTDFSELNPTSETFKPAIESISSQTPDQICLTLGKTGTEIPQTKQYMSHLNEAFNDNLCKKICSGLNENTNILCSLIYYINIHISDFLKNHETAVVPPKVNLHSITDQESVKPKTDNVKHNTTRKSVTEEKQPIVQHEPPNNLEKITVNTDSVERVINVTNTHKTNTTVVKKENAIPIDSTSVLVKDSLIGNINNENIGKNDLAKAAKDPIIVQPKVAEIAKPITVAKILTPPSIQKPVVTNTSNVELPKTSLEIQVDEPVKESEKLKPSTVVETPNSQETNKDGFETAVDQDVSYESDFNTKEEMPLPAKDNDDSVDDHSVYGHPVDKSVTNAFDEVEDSNFFTYFMFISIVFIFAYIAYHNKQKILALVLEGRKDRGSRRRPNTASYRKLNSNLEEAVTSKSSGSAAHVIY